MMARPTSRSRRIELGWSLATIGSDPYQAESVKTSPSTWTSDIEQSVIEHRFALGNKRQEEPDASPLTLEQVGQIIGVTKERVRQIQNKALEKIQKIRDGLLPQMEAKDAHYLVKSVEVRGILLVTELFLRASLMRAESRAGHYREDYPDRDSKNWLKWIIIKKEDGEYGLRTEPVSLEKYKFKPTRYYSDNFTFPNNTRREYE